MTDMAEMRPTASADGATPSIRQHLKRRHRAEKRFRFLGFATVLFALCLVLSVFASIISKGYMIFGQAEVRLDIVLDAAAIDPDGTNDPKVLAKGNYSKLIKNSLAELFPDVKKRRDKRDVRKLLSSGAVFELQDYVMANPDEIGKTVSIWLPASDHVDMLLKGHISTTEGAQSGISAKQLTWIETLQSQDRLEAHFNWRFFSNGDSREPELAGILGALIGSGLTLLICLVLAFPIGVMAAVYLEEFAPKNRITDLIEININNLAAVPSIVFGLLGAAVLLNFLDMPRSAPLVGGVVLALMTLPTIIIAARSALQSVPPSIREAAFGIGASAQQVAFHHVLPLAMPGVLTGTIIGMVRAMGETAPLLMIGMVAFIVDLPTGPTDPATALPVQIYLWADAPERAFAERGAAAIMVLLSFLIVMNLSVAYLRRRFEKRW